jgi:hypothetical protein
MLTKNPADRATFERRLSDLSPEKRRYLERLLCQSQQGATARAALQPRRTRADTAPLSCAQQRLWIVCQLTQGSPFYNETFSIRFKQQLDIAALDRSINEIVRRHEVLRTASRIENGTQTQVISPVLRVPLKVIDLRTVPHIRRET